MISDPVKIVSVGLSSSLLQHQFMPVLDGTLAAQHKAVILTSIDYRDADVVTGVLLKECVLADEAAWGGVC